ncbi:MAG: esterase family protein [Sphingobacteriia bacterium]|nr:MAG: esterase family protein [Sphingobacteriia bacterium]
MKKSFVFCLIVFSFPVLQSYASVDTIKVYSKAMHKIVKAVVIKPDTVDALLRFPTVYLLHGFSANYASWSFEAPQLSQKANALQMLFVMPDGGFGSWYFDSPVDSTFKYETFVTQELVNYIDSAYPTKTNRNSRAITGLSMGGHGAFYLAMRHKGIYGVAGSICGGVDIRPFPNNWMLSKMLGPLNDSAENWEKNTVVNIAATLKPHELNLIFDCGIDDFFFFFNRALHQVLLAKKIPHDYTERPGGHNAAYWGNSIDYHLLYFKKHFDQLF